MANLRDIRNRIDSVKNTQKVTRAMKMVAAAKLRRAQERIFQTRPYAFQIGKVLSHLKQELDPTSHPLFQEPEEVEGVLLIIVTADRGLAGAFNSNIIRLAEQTIQEDYAAKLRSGNLYLLCVGRKGHDYFKRRDFPLVGDFRGVFNDLKFDHVHRIADVAVEGFVEGRWGQVKVVYNEFKNTISQNRIVEPLLPVPKEHFVTPVMEGEHEIQLQPEQRNGAAIDYIFEPSAEYILDVLVPRFVSYQLWRILLESNAAEQGARMVAMDNATSNADELLRNLRTSYNRARQDAITTEIIEITSGAEALSES